MINPVGWFDIYVDNITRAAEFYGTVFGVELSDLSDPTEDSVVMKAFPMDMEQYGASGALVQMAEVPAGQNSTVIYFSCEDCALEESRVEGAGGSVIRAKFPIGEHGFISLVSDTEGNTIGLHSMK